MPTPLSYRDFLFYHFVSRFTDVRVREPACPPVSVEGEGELFAWNLSEALKAVCSLGSGGADGWQRRGDAAKLESSQGRRGGARGVRLCARVHHWYERVGDVTTGQRNAERQRCSYAAVVDSGWMDGWDETVTGYLAKEVPGQPGTVRVDYITQADIKGWIPKWVIKSSATMQANAIITIRKMVDKYKAAATPSS